jgi:4'-phosphopantetheinyl transferase
MPLIVFQHILDEHGKLLIWQGTESLEQLRNKFWVNYPNASIPDFKLEKREREFLIGRILLHMVLPNVEVSNLPNGKPVVNGGWHISLSHTQDLVGLVVAEAPIGLDMQGPDEKLLRIAARFCNEKELEWIDSLPSPVEGALIVWSSKEAVFKVYGENIEFADEMSIHIRTPRQSTFTLEYQGDHGHEVFAMHQFSLKDVCVVYTLKGAS